MESTQAQWSEANIGVITSTEIDSFDNRPFIHLQAIHHSHARENKGNNSNIIQFQSISSHYTRTLTSDRSSLDSLHKMRGESSDLIPEPFAGDDGDFLGNPFVGVEIGAQLSVVFLHDDAGGLFHRFRANATHFFLLRFLSNGSGTKKIIYFYL